MVKQKTFKGTPKKQVLIFKITVFIVGIFFLFIELPYPLIGIILIIFGFFTNSVFKYMDKKTIDFEIKKHLNKNSPHPDLKDIEWAIAKSISENTGTVDLNFDEVELDIKKVLYLSQQYGVTVPEAHPKHPFHRKYLEWYNRIENSVLDGSKFSILNNDCRALQTFFDRYHPGVRINNIPPTEIEYYVAGLPYYSYNDDRVVNEIENADYMEEIVLVPEPENEYDALAVKIFFKGNTLGHVPRPINRKIAYAIRNNKRTESFLMDHDTQQQLTNRILIKTIIFH